MHVRMTVAAAMIAIGLGAALPANAAIIGAVGGVINAGGPGNGTLTETWDQSGLSANYVSGVTDFDSFVATTSHTTIFSGFEWFGNAGTDSASVTYDLGSVVRVDKMALWNEETSGIGLLDLLFSTDGMTFSALLSGLMPTDNPLVDYLADVFTFAPTDMRYVRMDMSRCPQPDPGTFDSCAIGEVAFNVAPVPVPAAGLLLVTALGGLGLMRRRLQG